MEADKVLTVATRLFAELGYDQTELELIARAAGVTPAWITEWFGGKQSLYKAVMRQANDQESAALGAALGLLAERAPTPAGVKELADAYLEFFTDHPEVLRLWMHRWMGDAADVPELEESYTRPLVQEVVGEVSPLLRPGLDPRFVVWTIVWSVYGFLTGGMLDRPRNERRVRGSDLREFRAHLHLMLDCVLLPTGTTPGR